MKLTPTLVLTRKASAKSSGGRTSVWHAPKKAKHDGHVFSGSAYFSDSEEEFIATAGPSLQDHDDDESHNAEDSSDLETDAKDVESHHDRADDYCTRMEVQAELRGNTRGDHLDNATPPEDSTQPSHEALCARQALTYKGYRYHCKNKDRTWLAMQWNCSRPTCDAQFKCDKDGNNFIDNRPDHNHTPPRKTFTKPSSSYGDCPICELDFKSAEEKQKHFSDTDHDSFQFQCDYSTCKFKWRSDVTMKKHLETHYGQKEGQRAQVSKFHGTVNSNLVQGLENGNNCPVCKVRIVCLSHYVWHMENVHNVRTKDVLHSRHLRCLACSACIPVCQAWKHIDVFCPFSVIAELRQAFASDSDSTLTVCDCNGAALVPHAYPRPLRIWSRTMADVGLVVTRKLSPLARE